MAISKGSHNPMFTGTYQPLVGFWNEGDETKIVTLDEKTHLTSFLKVYTSWKLR